MGKKSNDTDYLVERVLKKSEKRLKELDQGDSTDAFQLIEQILSSNALNELASKMAEDASNPPTDAAGKPILSWRTLSPEDQERVISYLLLRVHNTEVGLYNCATVLAAALQIGLFLGTGKRSGIFGGSGANSSILPLLLFGFGGGAFSLFGTARNLAIKVWDGIFGR